MQKITRTIITLLITLLLLLTLTTTPNSTTQTTTDPFTIVWISDTQYLSENHPDHYINLCKWIAQNKDPYNIQMVVHTGDIVNSPDNTTQWENANQSMNLLVANEIPYCWNAGNHDYTNANSWIGSQYSAFNPQTFQLKPYWTDSYQNGMNTAVCFNMSNQQWLIVNLAFHADDSALNWTNDLLDAYPQAHAIVATHAYIDRQCQYDFWATKLKTTVLDTHNNVFLTLSGHYHPTDGNHTRAGERDELLFNQQDAHHQLGSSAARLLTFNPDQKTINIKTYNVFSNQYLQDPNNCFTIKTDFYNDITETDNPSFLIWLVGILAVGICCCLVILLTFVVGRRRLIYLQL